MKKTTIYVLLLITAGFISCKGKEWDTEQELKELTYSWLYFVEDVMSYSVDLNDTLTYKNDKIQIVAKSRLKDSLFVEFKYVINEPTADSVNVTSTLTQIRDSIIVKTDGYRFSKNYWVHLFTVDTGIVNYEGKFHVDFYEKGKTIPWAWSEYSYHKNKKDEGYFSYKRGIADKVVVGWY